MARSLKDLDREDDQPLRIVNAFITKPVPTNETDPVWIRIPAFDAVDDPPDGEKGRSHKWGPCPWTPMTQQITVSGSAAARIIFPVVDDPCWAVLDGEDVPYVVGYWPVARGYSQLPAGK